MVVPTRDRPLRLLGAVRSVLTQSHAELELIVVDDASQVPAASALAAVSDDSRVRVIRAEPARGAAGARNLGLAHSTGDLVAFLDDDDRWFPNKLACQVTYLSEHPDVGFAWCHHLVVDETKGGRISVHRGPTSARPEQMLWANFAPSFSSVIARRSILQDELHCDEAFPSVEDWDLWLRCSRIAPVGVLDAVLYAKTIHTGPRLSDRGSELAGLQMFLDKHGNEMSANCRSFHLAHHRMLEGSGWRHRAMVARAMVTRSPEVSAILIGEQLARIAGRTRSDPGIVDRYLASATGVCSISGTNL